MGKGYVAKGITIKRPLQATSTSKPSEVKKAKIEVIDLISSSIPSTPNPHYSNLRRLFNTNMTEDRTTSSATPPLQEGKRDPMLYPLGFIGKHRYGLIERLAGGAYGDMYKAMDIERGELVAIKVSKESRTRRSFIKEVEVYKKLRGVNGFAKLKNCGNEDGKSFLVLELLGPSLHNLTPLNGMPIEVVANIGIQLISRLEDLHKASYTHRDIKPSNCCVDLHRQSGDVFLVDFGLVDKSPTESTSGALQRRKVNGIVGTKIFAPVIAHDRLSQGMADDLMGLGLTLSYIALGNLPWASLRTDGRQMSENEISSAKSQFFQKPVYNGRTLPSAFVEYFQKCASIPYNETPDYEEMRNILKSIPNATKTINWSKLSHWD